MKLGLTPGPGWKPAGGAVFDHRSGIRVHVGGLCRLRNGTVVSGMMWPESRVFNWFVRVNGGNRKRGAMAWAIEVAGVSGS